VGPDTLLPRHSTRAQSLQDSPQPLLATVQLPHLWVVLALDILPLPDSRLLARLSRLPHQLTARRHLHSCRRLLRHTLQHLPTTLRRLQICTSHRPVQTTLRRLPATLQPPPTTVHRRLILLGPKSRQVLDFPQQVLSTAQAVRTSLQRALNTREPSHHQNTPQPLRHTRLLVLNSHQPPQRTENDDKPHSLLDLYNNRASHRSYQKNSKKRRFAYRRLGFLAFCLRVQRFDFLRFDFFPSILNWFVFIWRWGVASLCQQKWEQNESKRAIPWRMGARVCF